MTAETLAEIAQAVHGEARGDGGRRPGGFSIDSRTCAAGDLFFAIVGPNRDGHDYVGGALERGAIGAVVSEPDRLPEEASGVVVDDTTGALQALATTRRKRLGPKVIGITGSSGKTTVKEMTRHALDGSFAVLASKGNLNNQYGLPLSILSLEERHQVAVLEMGISTNWEMKRLTEISDPDVGVLTNVYGAHLASFSSVDEYASAKADLFRFMRPNTTGIFNNDDPRSREISRAFHGYAVGFGMDVETEFTGGNFTPMGLDGCSFDLRHGGRRVEVRLRFAGRHHAMNALAALAAGYMLGCDLETMAGRLAGLEPLAMRGRVLRLKGGVRVLDDSYNANPAAMRAALSVIAQAGRSSGRRLAVLGDMLELGPEALARHREMGLVMAASGLDAAFTVGPLAREMAGAAQGAGFGTIRSFETAAEAESALLAEVRPGDTVLIKASRGVGLDRLVRALRDALGEERTGGGDA